MNQWEFLLWVLTIAAALFILAAPIYILVYLVTQAFHIARKDAYSKMKINKVGEARI